MKSLKNASFLRIIAKALLLLLIVNFAFILIKDLPIGRLSLYNSVVTGRERFPFGENPTVSYNLSMYNLDGMFASHEITGQKKEADEYRVFVVGDSSVWGFLQKPQDTLAGILNDANLLCGEKQVKVFNLGYPSLSVLKDTLIIDQARKYKPDLIIWMVTLESLPDSLQTDTPLVANNAQKVNRLIETYGLDFQHLTVDPLDYTLIARRRELADLFRLQFYGVLWSATDIDQEYPAEITPAQRDFEEDYSFRDFQQPDLDTSRLSLDVIQNTVALNPEIKFMLVNEPILISQGKNSNIRYDYYYPRWAYDQYRVWMTTQMKATGIDYYDLWDRVPESDFTNSAIHLNRTGEEILAKSISSILEEQCEEK